MSLGSNAGLLNQLRNSSNEVDVLSQLGGNVGSSNNPDPLGLGLGGTVDSKGCLEQSRSLLHSACDLSLSKKLQK